MFLPFTSIFNGQKQNFYQVLSNKYAIFLKILPSSVITLSKTGNSALNMEHTVSCISSLVPGSCPANWLQGNAKISNPVRKYQLWSYGFKPFRNQMKNMVQISCYKAKPKWETDLGSCIFRIKCLIPCSWNVLDHCENKPMNGIKYKIHQKGKKWVQSTIKNLT